ncbi:MAG: pentapeptide repeat-containing protein [Patescibacteria group bacterium]
MANKMLVDMIKRSVVKFNAWRAKERGRNPEAVIDLSGADLSCCKLDGIDFFKCVLEHASLKNASLVKANLMGASLTDTVLIAANLTDAQIMGACVASADFTDADLTGVTLRGVEGLETACFNGAFVEPKAQQVILAAVAESMRDPEPRE